MMASDPKLKAEIGPDGLAKEAPVIAYTREGNPSNYSLSLSIYVLFFSGF